MRVFPPLLLATLAGCASPDPHLYTLLPTNPAAPPPSRTGQAIELRTVDIPHYLDRPEIIRSAADYRVRLTSNDRWSAPLDDMITTVLRQDLAARMAGATIFTDNDAAATTPDVIVAVTITRLDPDGAGQVVLDAQFSVRAQGADSAVIDPVHLSVPADAGTAGFAAAASAAIGQLADAVVASQR